MKKIVHICLTAEYKNGFGYDENIMPKYHKAMGYEAYVFSFDENNKMTEEVNSDGIIIKRFSRGNRFGIISRFGDFSNVFQALCNVSPDVIYVHNAQFISFIDVIKYMKKNPEVKLYVDNHDDFFNCRIDTIKAFILHYVIFRTIFLLSIKYVRVFWGVTPWRCEFLHKVYGVPNSKIELLVMGVDDALVEKDRDLVRVKIREKYNLVDDDFVIVTGGKVTLDKNIHLLAESISCIPNINVKLIIFGSVSQEVKEYIDCHADDHSVIYTGFIEPLYIYQLFVASDLAVFPGTHSILWEQACGCGIPIAVKYWEGMQHLDLGGNVFYIHDVNVNSIKELLENIISNEERFAWAKETARTKAMTYFSYSEISKKAIEEN